ncbi:hypothetical protein [Streptomyces qinglanensis]
MTESIDALGAVLAAVVLVALAHPDPQMRAAAERVLRIIFRFE